MPTRWYDLDLDWQLTWAPDGPGAPIEHPYELTGATVLRVPAGAGQANVAYPVFSVAQQPGFIPEGYHLQWRAEIRPEANQQGGNTLHLDLLLGGPPSATGSVTVPPWTETPFRIFVTGSGEATDTALTFEGLATTRPRRGSVVSSAVAAIRRLFGRLFDRLSP